MKAKSINVMRVLLIAVLALGLTLSAAGLAGAVGEPEPGTVQGILTYSAYSSVVTGSLATVNSTSRSTRLWHSADAFVTVDLGANAAATLTAQLSPNNSQWANAEYNFAASDDTVIELPYRIVFTADGTDYVRFPLAGEYLRFSLTYTGPVTTTVNVTLRND
jgi:hypothetical protein